MAEYQKLSVFLCHSPADKAAMRDLYSRLSKYPWIDPWLDEEKLLPGNDRNGEISKALEKAHVVIIALSKDSITKEGPAQAEFKYAQKIALEKPEGAIFIIPLNLENVNDLDIPRKIKDIQSEDYFPNKKRASVLEKILKSLKVRANIVGVSYQEDTPIIATPKPSKNKYAEDNIVLAKGVVSTAEFPIHEIPFRRNLNFTGRKDVLDLIHNEFSAAQNRILVHTIRGMGGIGKTQTAIYYSYEYAKEYDLVYWIKSETDASLTADYEALTQALQLPVKTNAEQSIYINIVNSWLENTDKKWLLVFDNVESQEKIEKLLPRKGSGQILITSQSPSWKELGEDSQIKPFTSGEAREFIKRRLGKEEVEQADKLTELLGGLPLAMEQACAYMAAHGTPIEIYLQLFEEQQDELWQREISPKDYRSTIMTTWEMAFKQIQVTHPVARQLLNLFAFFGPDNIPLSIIKTYPGYLPENLREAVQNLIELDDNLSAIYSYSLVERNGDFVSFHRLVQDVIRTQLPSDIASKWLSIAVQIMKAAFPFDEYDVTTWKNCAQLLPHALAIASYAEKYSTGLGEAAEIYQKVGEYLGRQAEYHRAGEAFEKAINIQQEVLDVNHEKLAISLYNLGVIRMRQANYAKALGLSNQAFQIFEKMGKLETQPGARTIQCLGTVFQDLGEFEKAKNLFQTALASFKDILKEKHPDTASCLSSLGSLYQDEGDFEIAKKYLEEALDIYRVTLGKNHPDIAFGLGNLGTLLAANRKELDVARKYQEEALAIRRITLGDNHPDTATSFFNIADLFAKQGEVENAQKYLEQTRAIYITVLGENHPDTAKVLGYIGWLLTENGRYVEAKHYFEESLSILEKVYGATHHDLLSPLFGLASVMFHLKLFPLARQYSERAIKICSEAKVRYRECGDIEKLQKLIPMIGKPANRKKKHKRS